MQTEGKIDPDVVQVVGCFVYFGMSRSVRNAHTRNYKFTNSKEDLWDHTQSHGYPLGRNDIEISVGRLNVLCREAEQSRPKRSERMNSLFGWLHKCYDLWTLGLLENVNTRRWLRKGRDSLRWRSSLIMFFLLAFVFRYKHFSSSSWQWYWVMSGSSFECSHFRVFGGDDNDNKLNKVSGWASSRGQWYDISAILKYLWETVCWFSSALGRVVLKKKSFFYGSTNENKFRDQTKYFSI